MDFTQYGKCVGAMWYGGVEVEFWFESLSGDSTDSFQFQVAFPTWEMAAMVARSVRPREAV